MSRLRGMLNERELAFCVGVAKHGNKSKAAKDAGYAFSNAQTSRLMRNPLIVAEIARLRMAAQKQRERDQKVTVARVTKELAAVAFSNLADLVDEHGKLRPLADLPEDAQRAIASLAHDGKLTMHSKLTALRMLMDHLGMDAPRRAELSGPEGAPIKVEGVEGMSRAELEARFRELTEKK